MGPDEGREKKRFRGGDSRREQETRAAHQREDQTQGATLKEGKHRLAGDTFLSEGWIQVFQVGSSSGDGR